MFEDDETLRMYVDESLEHLSNIENDLLAIGAGMEVGNRHIGYFLRKHHSPRLVIDVRDQRWVTQGLMLTTIKLSLAQS